MPHIIEICQLLCSQQSVTFLVSKPVSKPKCQSQECDIFGFETGFETKMSFSAPYEEARLYYLLRLYRVSNLKHLRESHEILITDCSLFSSPFLQP